MSAFPLGSDKYLFFDIFHKNNELILICPVYTGGVDSSKLQVNCGTEELALTNKHSEINYEPIEILIYSFSPDKAINTVQVTYGDIRKEFTLEHFTSSLDKTVALTTLFKHDYKIIPMFYDYYKKQGVSKFYLYYNGALTDEIRNICALEGVVLVEWNFAYWNEDYEHNVSKFKHHAQLGHIHHALYRYGKKENEYMIFCDLDEYMYIPNQRISTYVYNNPAVNVFGFCNVWANMLDNQIPDKFPPTIKVANHKKNFGERSKCIYKTESLVTMAIHTPKKMAEDRRDLIEHVFFHFYSWTGARRYEYIECSDLLTLELAQS
jgi:hypothetical protein